MVVHNDVASFGDDAFELHAQLRVGFDVAFGVSDEAWGTVEGFGVVLAVGALMYCATALFFSD